MKTPNFNHTSSNSHSPCPECLAAGRCLNLGSIRALWKEGNLEVEKLKTLDKGNEFLKKSQPQTNYRKFHKRVDDMLAYLPLAFGRKMLEGLSGEEKYELEEAILAFDMEDYAVAYKKMKPFVSVQNSGTITNFILAIIAFHIGKYNEAGEYMEMYKFRCPYTMQHVAEEFLQMCEVIAADRKKSETEVDNYLNNVIQHTLNLDVDIRRTCNSSIPINE